MNDYARHNQRLRESYMSSDRPVTRRIVKKLMKLTGDQMHAVAIFAGFIGDGFWPDPSVIVNTDTVARFLTRHGLSPEKQSRTDAIALLQERAAPYLPF